MYNLLNHLKPSQFYKKNLFERLIVYIFAAELLARIYVEGLLGENIFYHPRLKQWIFYMFLASDYIISFPKLLCLKVGFNAMSAFALFLFMLIIQGTVVGLANNNQLFNVINDIIPLLMIAFNILRMQSVYEKRYIDFDFLVKFSTVFMVLSMALSFISFGKPAGIHNLYLVLVLGAVFSQTKLNKLTILIFFLTIALGINAANRTTLLFIILMALVYGAKVIMRSPKTGVLFIILGALTVASAPLFIPEDSMLMSRINGTKNIDLNSRKGSVGERQQEWDSINLELKKRGFTDELVGFGMGGTFSMQSTHQYIEGYGHAHYSWAWFKLRFGNIGFVYLGVLITVLGYQIATNMRILTIESQTITVLSIFSMLYLLTYVNWIWLLSGLQFLHTKRPKKL